MLARFLWILCMGSPDEIWGANDPSRFSLREMIFILWFFTSSDSNSILLLNFSTTWKTIFTLEKYISWNKTGCFIFRSNEWSVLIHRMSGAVGGEEFWEDRILHPPPPSPSPSLSLPFPPPPSPWVSSPSSYNRCKYIFLYCGNKANKNMMMMKILTYHYGY